MCACVHIEWLYSLILIDGNDSFKCPSVHARKRWVTALTQRINHFMEASAHAVEVSFCFIVVVVVGVVWCVFLFSLN
jgi:hypothetical protein